MTTFDTLRGQTLEAIADRLKAMTVAGGYHWTVKATSVHLDPINLLALPETELPAFLVEPSHSRGQGPNKRTEKFDVYVEVIGNSTLGGGATAGQEIRKDVPYLIECD